MSDEQERYRLEIDGWTPESLPMERLALYLAELARLLGSSPSVHFKGVEKGSAVLLADVDPQVREPVRRRVRSLHDGSATKDALRAASALDKLLEDDGTSGRLVGGDNVIRVDFPGKLRPRPLRYGPFRQPGSLDGIVTKIGGFDASVPVWLSDGEDVHRCSTTVEISKQLASYYLGDPVRVYGIGRWQRAEDGTWTLDVFNVESFEPLGTEPLVAVVERARAVSGSEWASMEDPLGFAERLRRGH